MAIIQGNAKQGSTRGFYPKIINGSLRFNDDDSAYLSWTPASAGNLKTLTYSTWIKRGNLSVGGFFFTVKDSGLGFGLRFNSSTNVIDVFPSSGGTQLTTTAVYRDPSAWYHIVMAIDTTQATASNRVKLYVNGEQVTSFSTAVYPTQNLDTPFGKATDHYIGAFDSASLPFDGYMANTYFIDGQALTASDFGETKNGVWVAKDYAGTFGTNGFYLTFEDDTQVEAFNATLHRGNGAEQSITGTGFSPDLVWVKNRDQADNHMLYDTVRGPKRFLNSNGTAAESYSSNDLESFDADGFTVQNDPRLNTSGESFVSWQWDAGANNAVTGHSSVTYTGDGGTQKISGFPFRPDLVWTKSRSQAYWHTLYDSVRGAGQALFSNDPNQETPKTNEITSFTNDGFICGNSVSFNESGQTYVSWAWDAGDSDPVSNTDGSITSTVKASQANGFSIVSYTGTGANATVGHGLSNAPDLVIVKSRTHASSWRVWSNALSGDQYLVLDSTNAVGTQATAWNSTTPTSSVISLGSAGDTNSSGNNFIAYCFHDVTGKQKFGTYSGGTNPQTITTGFRPGWLMIKATSGANNWIIYDGSRDPLNPCTASLCADSSAAENGVSTASENLVEFTDNGFTLTTTNALTNASSVDYIYAAFAGSYSDYITDYNTDGSIDSRVKASDTTGFSIVSYEGTGVNGNWGHGLSAAPDMVIVKNRDNGGMPWLVYHSSNTASPETDYLLLNSTAATTDFNTAWNDTSPTSTVFNVGTADGTNQSGYRHIAYCWAEKTGYSKFGSWTGTGSTFKVTTGFKPSLIIVKRTNTTGDWILIDGTRDVSDPRTVALQANNSGVEFDSSSYALDFLDDGFNVDATTGNMNNSGDTYIYAAFADTREAAFWLDQSGNDNDWQPVNLDHNDTVLDSPTNNFCTWNSAMQSTVVNGSVTLSDGNLVTQDAGTTYGLHAVGTMVFTSGQWYWEIEATDVNGYAQVGVYDVDKWPPNNSDCCLGYVQTGYSTDFNHSSAWGGTGNTAGAGATYTDGDVIGIALDMDNKDIHFYKNGTFQFTLSWTEDRRLAPGVGDGANATTAKFTANFGQQPFKYDPPA